MEMLNNEASFKLADIKKNDNWQLYKTEFSNYMLSTQPSWKQYGY